MKKMVMIFMMLSVLVGCKADMTEEAQQKIHFVKAEKEVGDRTPEERAMSIKSRLKQLDECIGMAVVVEGHTAIIGLRLKDGMEQNEIDAVKRKADILARDAEVSVESISVTTNGYIVSMIEEVERKRAG